MSRCCAGLAAAIVALCAGPAMAAEATPPVALVISNSAYSALPKLPQCELSANLVAAVLSRAGFRVTRQTNLSNARLGTAIAGLGEEASAAPGSRSVIYLCSYALAYSDRLFVLPSEARLDRESDVLSQGIVARLLMSSVAGPGSAAGLVLMDVASAPGKAPLEFSSMLRPSDASHGGLIAASLPSPDAAGPAPLESAVSETVGEGKLEVGALVTALSANPALRRSLLTARPPADPSWLLGGEMPAPPAPEPPPAAASASASASPIPAPAAQPAPPVIVPPTAATELAEPNPAERRRLQLALSRLGYYRGRVDGLFAVDTATAIRQFQRDSNAEATGKLTVRQMEQLLQ